MEKREPTTSYDRKECTEHVEKPREVVKVGPEEDPTRRTGTEWEAKEPLKRGFEFGSTP